MTSRGCAKAYLLEHEARGWCKRHWNRWRYHGDPFYEPPTFEERFWSKVAVGDPDECWPWTAPTRKGYGGFGRNGRMVPAHRIAYELVIGPIPDGHDVHHRCENRACCNPGDLECLPRKEHSERHYPLHLPERTDAHNPICTKHPAEAQRRYPNGQRYCAICNRERVAAWKARQPVRTW